MSTRVTLFTGILFIITACTPAPEKPFKPEYTIDWFSYVIPNWQKQLSKYKDKKVRYLEVGVFEGRSAFWMLENILTHKESKAVLVDLYLPSFEKRFLKNLRNNPHRNKAIVKKGESEKILRKLKPNSFDIIYIDGGHSAKLKFLDAAYSWSLLKPGGLLIFDNYDHLSDDKKWPIEVTPKITIDTFLTAFSNDLKVIFKDKIQVFVRRNSEVRQFKDLYDVYFPSYIGPYRYNWAEEKLYQLPKKNIIALKENEHQILKEIFLSKQLGDVEFRPPKKIFGQPGFESLATKLNLDVEMLKKNAR